MNQTEQDPTATVAQDDERACEICVDFARADEPVTIGFPIYGYNTCECQPTVCRLHQAWVVQRFTCPFCGN